MKKLFIILLKFKSNWASCILSDNPTPDPHRIWRTEVDLLEVSLASLLRNSWKPWRTRCLVLFFPSWILPLSSLQKRLHNNLHPLCMGVQADLSSVDELYNDFWVFAVWPTLNHSHFFDQFGIERFGVRLDALAPKLCSNSGYNRSCERNKAN